MSQISSEWIQLENGPRAWYARPSTAGPHPAIVVFIEAFGVNQHFQDVAERLARAGFCAIVPDLYHGKTYEYSDFDRAIGHLKTLNDELAMAEAGLAIQALHQRHPARLEGLLRSALRQLRQQVGRSALRLSRARR